MGDGDGQGRYEQPDNAAILQRRYRERYGEKPGLAAGRVVLNPHAFTKGWLVTFGIWSVSTLIFSLAGEILGPNSGAVTVWGFTMVVSLLVAIFIAAPLALMLSLLLRKVLNQWLHVAAFVAVFAGLAGAVTALMLPVTAPALPTILAAVVGVAAGLGRAAIIRDVNP